MEYGNVLLFPAVSQDTDHESPIECREQLGGLLKYYKREAALVFDHTRGNIEIKGRVQLHEGRKYDTFKR